MNRLSLFAVHLALLISAATAASELPAHRFADGGLVIEGTDPYAAPVQFRVPKRLPRTAAAEVTPVAYLDHQTVGYAGGLDYAEPSEDESEYFTLDELKEEMKDLVWRKGEFKIVPYGAFWADMVYATQRTNPGAYTLFVFSPEVQGEDAFTIDARRSRLGFFLTGPRIPLFDCAESSGQFEIDFHGDFTTENKATVLLRHFYWQVKNERFRAMVGQYWDLISPLYPGTLNYSVGWLGGNIGYRRTQFRYERYFTVSDRLWWTAGVALAQDIVTDFPTDPGIRRESSDWPVVMGRIGVKLGCRGEGYRPIEFGVSGHVGETGFDFLTPGPLLDEGPPPVRLPPEDDARFNSWSFNVDVHIPITDRLGFQGEFFTGANLSAFLGGIGQGVCPCLRVPIRSTGGWLEVWYDWTPRLHSHAGWGVDDPNDNDTVLGRVYNQFIFANLVYDITPNLITGFEVTYWKTNYHEERVGRVPDNLLTPNEDGDSVVLDWMVKYGF